MISEQKVYSGFASLLALGAMAGDGLPRKGPNAHPKIKFQDNWIHNLQFFKEAAKNNLYAAICSCSSIRFFCLTILIKSKLTYHYLLSTNHFKALLQVFHDMQLS